MCEWHSCRSNADFSFRASFCFVLKGFEAICVYHYTYIITYIIWLVYIYIYAWLQIICIIVYPHVCGITGSILKRWCWNSWRKSRASSFAMICSQLWPVSQVETYEACRENMGNNLTKSDYPMLIKGGLLSHTAIFFEDFPMNFLGDFPPLIFQGALGLKNP